MTEPRIASLLGAVADHAKGDAGHAAELLDLAALVRERLPELRIAEIVARRCERIAHEITLAIEPLERLTSDGSDEDTQPVILSRDHEICTRCHGTGETPVVK